MNPSRQARVEQLESRLLLSFTEISASTLFPGATPVADPIWIDFNNDHWTDVVVSGYMYRNDLGTGGGFTKLDQFFGAGGDIQFYVADFDNDGWDDLIFSSGHDNADILRNVNGTGKFRSVSSVTTGTGTAPQSATVGDFDDDGFVDVYIPGFENFPSAYYPDTFLLNVPVTPTADNPNGRGLQVAWRQQSGFLAGRGATSGDINEDGSLDIYISNYRLLPNNLLINDQSGPGTPPFTVPGDMFLPFNDLAGTYDALAQSGHGIGAAVGDLDSDGHLDILAGNFSHDATRLSQVLHNQGPGGSYHFTELGPQGIYYRESWASPGLGDFDNDGMVDLFFTALESYSDNSQLFRNTGSPGNPQFAAVDEGIPGNLGGYDVSWADYDNDGDLDLATNGRFFRNDLSSSNHWLKLKLRGDGQTVDGSAVGAIVRVTAGNLTVTRQVESGTGQGNQNDTMLHFGLGSHSGNVSVAVTWPDGSQQNLSVAPDQTREVSMVPNTTPTVPGDLSVVRVLHDEATVLWVASTDVEEDPLNYDVKYQPDDESTAWSNVISTADTSLRLSGLESNTSYRVRVRADDGSSTSYWNLQTNLFTTDPPAFATGFIGETGLISSLTDQSQTILLQQSYVQPVVFAQSPSYNGSQQVTVRVTDVMSDRFSIYLQEPGNLDGTHGQETVSYLVVEAGTWRLSGGQRLEVGTVDTSATVGHQVSESQFENITFDALFSATPVMLSQVQTANDTAFVKTRQDSASTSGVQLALEGEDVVTLPHGQETIGYLAIDSGSGAWGGFAWEAMTTGAVFDNADRVLTFNQVFGQAPHFLSSLASYNGADPAALRYNNLTGTNVRLTVEEETTADTEVVHSLEAVSYLAIGGSGLLPGAPAAGSVVGETGTITDLDHQLRTILLRDSYNNPVVLAQSASYNGANPVVVRVTDVQSDRFSIYLQEPSNQDGIHGAETVSYLVMEAGAWQLSDGTLVEAGAVSTSATVGRQVTDQWETVSLATSWGNPPVLLSQVQTSNDTSFVKTRQQNITAGDFQVALEGEEDDASAHGKESIGYLAIAAGTGQVGAVQFEAATTAPLFDNTGQLLLLDEIFSRTPDGFLSSLSSFNGADTAWLRYDIPLTWDGARPPTESGFSEVSDGDGVPSFSVNQDENGAQPGVTLFDSLGMTRETYYMSLDNVAAELVRANGWYVEFRVNTLDNTGDRFGNNFAVEDDVGGIGILLNPTSLEIYKTDFLTYPGAPELGGPQPISLGFHAVRLTMAPGGTHFEVQIDGNLLGSVAGDVPGLGGPKLVFGDGSSKSEGRAVWDYVDVNEQIGALVAPFDWDGSTLPTAAGYSQTGSSKFTANRDENGANQGVTLFDSLGNVSNSNFMTLNTATAELVRAVGWFIQFRVNSLDNTGDRFGNFFLVEDDVGALGILLNPDSLEFYRGDWIDYHTGIPELGGLQAITPGFHTVRIEMAAGGTQFEVSVDGNLLGSVPANAQLFGTAGLRFGDGSSGSASRAVWDYIIVNQEVPGLAGTATVSEPAFRVYIQEDTTVDMEVIHSAEAISYFAFDGQGLLSGQALTGNVMGETGIITDLTDQPQVIQLKRNYLNPVVIAQSPSYNSFEVATVRVSGVRSDRFTVLLQEPSDLDGAHLTAETVSYLVVEAGQWMLADGTLLEAGTFSTDATVGSMLSNPQWYTLSYQDSFATAPVVLSQVVTDNNASYVKTRQQNLNSSGIDIALEGEEAAGSSHGTETLGYLVIEAASGLWSGIPFEAATTGQLIDNIGQTVTFSQNFGAAPALLVSTSSYTEMDNVALRYATLTDRGVKLFAEEDTTFDTETIHGAESVSYLAIGGMGLLSAVPPVPPHVTSVVRNDGGDNFDILETLSFSFDQNVNVAVDGLGLVDDAAGGVPVDLTGVGFNYDPGSRTASWDFSGVSGVTAAAWYRVTLDATEITGLSGMALDGDGDDAAGGDHTHTFLVARRGDADLNGRIDIADFNTLALRFDPLGLNSGNDWSRANFDEDGDVDISDFAHVLRNFSPLGYTLSSLTFATGELSTDPIAGDSTVMRAVSANNRTDARLASTSRIAVEPVREQAFAEWSGFDIRRLLLDDVATRRRTRPIVIDSV